MVGQFKNSILVVLQQVLILLAVACVAAPNSNREIDDTSDIDSGNTSTNPNFGSNEQLYWFHQGQSIQNTVLIEADISTVIYLRGQKVHEFLELNDNDQQVFCLAVSYSTSGALEQLRARALPDQFINFSTGAVEKILRIDIQNETTNSNNCAGTANGATSPADVAFVPSTLCVGCLTIFNSTVVQLYQSTSGTISDLSLVPTGQLDLALLSMRIDPTSTSSGGGGSCTNQGCQAQGFDCCFNNAICVNAGGEQPNASLHPDYPQAIADVMENFQNYINWPEIFYICSGAPPPTPTPTPPPDAVATANAELQNLIHDYYCLADQRCQDGESEYCDDSYTCVSAGNCYTPTTDVDTQLERITLGLGIQSILCDPLSAGMTYTQVHDEMLGYCGCAANSATPAPGDPDTVCPDWGYKAIKNPAGIITNIECDIPPAVTPTSFPIEVPISGRRAPHRFFKTDGSAIDDINTIANSGITNEGTAFSYLDDVNKTAPFQHEFNFNAVVGQMAVELTHALPAKTINVQQGQVYILSINTGNYTPCPMCSKDSWFSGFTAFPPASPASPGLGLKAIGHTTSRDLFSTNITGGNYGDTIFGRACWLPPTMIPFSHQADADTQTQRLNRLETQAALFANGYQRDWFGFNKGAIIGSFDGVAWFPVGKGRRVIAKTNKLFLAINAPYADLATVSTTTVDVHEDLTGTDIVAFHDFDYTLSNNHPKQNEGGLCQLYHACDTDTDCVSKLGWEYQCADVTSYKTLWPTFGAGADENNNSGPSRSIAQILQAGMAPAPSTKRCVYRGAGAPCKQDYTNLPSTNLKKLFTCAPNFYCAPLTDSFNDTAVRTPVIFTNLLYGQEADFLGRPEFYINPSSSLSAAVQSNLTANFTNQDTQFTSDGDFGLCKPGKQLDASINPDWTVGHTGSDGSGRTDYISQISSCNSSTTGQNRLQTCPIIDPTTLDYKHIDNPVLTSSTDINQYAVQNSCGAASQTSAGINAFAAIEAAAIPALTGLVLPSLAQDACFRRAGAVCHTNLDCSPNKMHQDQAIFFGTNYFGDTEAEQKYWQESLICGQSDPIPSLSDSNFDTYNMSLNRCCRESGLDFTMYTGGDPDIAATSPGLDTSLYPFNDPTASGRYSRYSIVDDMNISSPADGRAQKPQLKDMVTEFIPEPYQWKTFNETGEKTCCGGSWIRKFSDGTNNWSINNTRLSLDVANFQCLNYDTDLLFSDIGGAGGVHSWFDGTDAQSGAIKTGYIDELFQKGCIEQGEGACLQQQMTLRSSFEVIPPTNPTVTEGVLDTTPDIQTQSNLDNLTHEAPYLPEPFFADDSEWTGSRTTPNMEGFSGFTFMCATTQDAISLQLPAYIGGPENIIGVNLVSDTTSVATIALTELFDNDPTGCNDNFDGMANHNYCIGDGPNGTVGAGNQFIIRVTRNAGARGPNGECDGVQITFRLAHHTAYESDSSGTTSALDQALIPGTDFYYTTALARLELLGIPQMWYQPLYCTSNRERMVPGIFSSTVSTRTNFEDTINQTTFVYDGTQTRPYNVYDSTTAITDQSNSAQVVTLDDNITLPEVFSSSDFMCCRQLGSIVDDPAKCCSGHGVTSGNDFECKLPDNTNLSVYFNRFVSNEGEGSDEPGGGLDDNDFIPETGEPKLTASVFAKLQNLGQEYCESGAVESGNAFEFYIGEPNSGAVNGGPFRIYSMVDSTQDFVDGEDAAVVKFNQGRRWNHQIYCSPSN